MNLPHSNQLHLWFASLKEDSYQAKSILLLTAEEIRRADRFKFALHRKRFITARASLRSILSLYLNIKPQEIELLATANGKLYIGQNELAFNLSHSHDLALYAFAYQMEVGIDLEKIRTSYNEKLAKRFFSADEYAALSLLTPQQKITEFYRIWTGKEAVVKALGEKISFSLSSFSISSGKPIQQVHLAKASSPILYLENPELFPDYQATLATTREVSHLSYWEWTPEGPKKWREDEKRSAT